MTNPWERMTSEKTHEWKNRMLNIADKLGMDTDELRKYPTYVLQQEIQKLCQENEAYVKDCGISLHIDEDKNLESDEESNEKTYVQKDHLVPLYDPQLRNTISPEDMDDSKTVVDMSFILETDPVECNYKRFCQLDWVQSELQKSVKNNFHVFQNVSQSCSDHVVLKTLEDNIKQNNRLASIAEEEMISIYNNMIELEHDRTSTIKGIRDKWKGETNEMRGELQKRVDTIHTYVSHMKDILTSLGFQDI
jgi:hypothetical protein